jgi:hypothetical protein
MAYPTLAGVMVLICGLAILAGAASLTNGLSEQMATTQGVIPNPMAVKAAVLSNDVLAATTALNKAGSIIVVDNALLVSVHGNAMVDNGMPIEKTYHNSTVASLNHGFNNSTGVANINVAAGNLNLQSIYYSGPDLASIGSLANGGSAKPAATHK